MRASAVLRSWAQNIHKHTDIVMKQNVGPNREALQLYRDILRTCRGFYWNDVDGTNWYVHYPPAARAAHKHIPALAGETNLQ